MTTTGILIFDGAEELDFVGPWEIFTMAAKIRAAGDQVLLIGESEAPVRCAKGMRVLPDRTLLSAPPLDVLLVPGGEGTREPKSPAFLKWLAHAGAAATWLTSVCTGSLLLHTAGLVNGRRVTTHWSFIDALRRLGDVTVLEDVRYVHDGNLVTAAGVSAGIDMALWLVGQLHGPDLACMVQRAVEYYPAPPYSKLNHSSLMEKPSGA